MDKLIDAICSPKLGMILLGPLAVYLLAQGCREMESRRPRRG